MCLEVEGLSGREALRWDQQSRRIGVVQPVPVQPGRLWIVVARVLVVDPQDARLFREPGVGRRDIVRRLRRHSTDRQHVNRRHPQHDVIRDLADADGPEVVRDGGYARTDLDTHAAGNDRRVRPRDRHASSVRIIASRVSDHPRASQVRPGRRVQVCPAALELAIRGVRRNQRGTGERDQVRGRRRRCGDDERSQT